MNSSTFESVKDVIADTLGIADRARIAEASTPLFGNIPELDSFAVLSLASALESRFGFQIDDDDFTGEIFETVGSLAAFVDRHRTH
ncbi:acyl carrier protein [Rhizobium sp. CF122]|jgi:acyl carrier protein|uniref:acyl carrier protein n=1 Tax=Rhizobium sp. CF122 TaxID=1144312 RepID=UPI0002715CA5|nr:acyl carrier protein [Rhizobium sp. CF122]EJL50977.1 acyl carrier protein [Rhizobium sp. CF122]